MHSIVKLAFAASGSMAAPSAEFGAARHADLSAWTTPVLSGAALSSAPPLNFTQFVCKGTNALNECEDSKGTGCDQTTHAQGACLTSGGGKQSLTVVCKQTPLGVNVDITIYAGVANCTGTPNPFTEKADFCYQSGGGQEFFKYECQM
jgi:hypothetical protein